MNWNTSKILLSGLLLLLGFPTWTQIQVDIIGRQVYDPAPFLFLLEDPAGKLSIDQIRTDAVQDQFQPYETVKSNLHTGFTYWGRFQVVNNLPVSTATAEWVLKFPLLLTDIEVYAVNQDQQWQYGRSGFFVPLYERTFAPASKANLVKISLPPGEKNTIYFRAFSGRRGSIPELVPQLIQADHYFQSLVRKRQHHALFTGFIMMMLIYNFFLFFYARDRAYIFYSLYLLGIVIFSAYNSGDLVDKLLAPVIAAAPKQVHYFKLVTYLVLIAYMAFLRHFLELNRLLPFWDRTFRFLSLAAVPILLFDAFLMYRTNFNYDIADTVSVSYVLVFVLLSSAFIFPLFRTRDKKGYFIIAGIAAMDTGIFITILDRLQTVDYSLFFFKIGNILEVIAFSLGLAYRQRSIEREKQAARFDLEKSQLLHKQEKLEAQRLHEVSQLKARLYTNITHELRTPLSVIKGMADEISGNETPKKMIQRNSRRLLRLVRQILDLSKLESGTMPLHWRQIDVIRFLRYATESFQSYAAARKIELEVKSEVEVLHMDVDEEKLQQILSNLLSNAIKYTPAEGHILLHISEQPGDDGQRRLKLIIQDDGQGIPEEHLSQIFDRFYQIDQTPLRHDESTGIGLAVVKELVQLMGGSISVSSKLGAGSIFRILLPISQNALPGDPAEMPIETKLSPQTDGPDPVIQFKQDKETPILLLIEDNADVAYYVQSILRENYNLLTARDGKEGIKMALEHIPDIIVSDVRMPGKSGFEVCEKLKKDERTSHIPILLLTAQEEEAGKIKGWRSGADEYLTKPFDKEELLTRLEQLLEERRRMQAYYGQQTATTPMTQAPSEVESQFLEKLRQVILQNIEDEDFSISDLCREIRLTHNQLYRKIKVLTGKTPSLYVRSIRMERAITLLKTTDLNVSQVAFAVGFKDPSYFSRVFQQEFGHYPKKLISPS